MLLYKIILKIFFYFLVILISLSLIPYLAAPVYDYPERTPFNGNKLYNPYSNIESGKWLKANFHAHSLAWAGFTNGRENICNEMKDRYLALGYDIVSISDYMKINNYMSSDKYYVPVYEHGFGFTKNHQLVIGAENVNWTDYPYYQTIDHKQKTLKEIKADNNVIVLAHPHLRNAYCKEDLKKLTGYDCIEVSNQNFGNSTDLWDDALSNGNPVYCVADDDSHNSTNFCDMGRCYTLVNSDTASFRLANFLHSIKNGSTIAVELNTGHNQSYNNLCSKTSLVPSLVSFIVNDSSFTIKLSKKTEKIIFTGQNGIEKGIAEDTNIAAYTFLPSDTYIRTTLICSDGSKLYLNPVMRYSGANLPVYSAIINESATMKFRLLYCSLFITIAAGFIYYKRRKYKKGVPVATSAEY